MKAARAQRVLVQRTELSIDTPQQQYNPRWQEDQRSNDGMRCLATVDWQSLLGSHGDGASSRADQRINTLEQL